MTLALQNDLDILALIQSGEDVKFLGFVSSLPTSSRKIMDFIEQLKALATKIEIHKHLIQTEEATKNAMVMPFIQMLGYDIFNPQEVTPELIADVGTKKGEKVDYALLQNGKPIVLFECKRHGVDLNVNHASQLCRYFHSTEAKFGVLTNGTLYCFFTDLEQPNKMDEKPFLEFNLLDFRVQEVDELKKFAKNAFNATEIFATANELKYLRLIKNLLAEWIKAPSEEFVRLVSADLWPSKRFTPAVRDQFTAITKRAFQQLIADRISERLKAAMNPDAEGNDEIAKQNKEKEERPKIITTADEIEGHLLIQTLLKDVIDESRVVMRDAQSYCAILFDGNGRKPICRLRFNNPKRLAVGLFDGDSEERVALSAVSDLCSVSDRLKTTVQKYLQGD